MSAYELQVLPAPIGMASNMEASGTPPNLARYLEGLWPARLGMQKPRPVPRKLAEIIPVNTGEQIQGYAFYHCRELTDLTGDLLVFTDRHLYVIPVHSTRALNLSDPVKAFAEYNRTPRGQTFSLKTTAGSFGTSPSVFQTAPRLMATSDWPSIGFPAGTINNVASTQFENELLFTIPGTAGATVSNGLWRYYREFSGVNILRQHLYLSYIPAGGAPTIVLVDVARDPTPHLTGTYRYAWTWVDELGRESSPSDSQFTPLLNDNIVTVQRGSTATGTATAPLAGWYLYRRNPGSNVYNRVTTLLPVATLTYIDAAPDTAINGNAVMPDPGENDPPDESTFLTVHKGRVVMNSLYNFGVVQLSNASSATQFSSITLPTNTAMGLRLEVGDDSEHVITGLESIGDMLWISKPSSYYLLQGSSIDDWDLQQVGKNRGSDNFFSVQRTEELIMFRSGDGVYGLSYQAGMVSPKMSWQIDDILGGFASPLTPYERQPFGGVFTPAATDTNAAGEPQISSVLAQYIDWSRSFYWQQRYFLCLPDRTLVFDQLTKEWADSGLGPVKWPTVYNGFQSFSVSGTPYAGLPDTVFFSYGGMYSGDLNVYYMTSVDTPYEKDGTSTYTLPYIGRELTHNFDAGQEPLSGKMRGKRLTIYGETGKRRGAKLGTVQFIADGRKCGGPIPLYAYMTDDKEGSLCQVGCPGDYAGQQLWAELLWMTSDIVITKRMLEFIRLS